MELIKLKMVINHLKKVLFLVVVQIFGLYAFLLMAQSPKEIKLVQDLVIGGDTSGVFFGFWPVKIAVTSNGTIFVADPQAYSIKKFSKGGVFLGQTGQPGRGPGDFDYLRSIEHCFQNQICVLDGNARISVFDAETLTLKNTISVPNPGSDRLWTPMGMKVVTEGFIVWYNRGLIANRIGDSALLKIALINMKGEFISEDLKTVRNNQMFVMETPFLWRTRLPFGRTSHIDIGRSNTLFYGWSENITIERLNLDDSTADTMIHRSQSVEVTKEERETVLNSFSANSPQGQAFRKRAHIPETYPAYDWFFADNHNRIWVAVNIDDRDNYALLLFDDVHQFLGQTLLPKSVELQKVRNNHAYGVHKNEKDETTIIRFKIFGV